VAEGLLRLLGYQPWRYMTLDSNEPTVYEPDPVLGWRNRQGSWSIPPYHPDGSTIRLTFLEDGRRLTSHSPRDASKPKIILLGGSFMQGWAIDDDETLAWKLQTALPGFEVVNFGTGGYGTFQSLLTLERRLPSLRDVRVVIYGFSVTHEARNVAAEHWQHALTSFSRRGHAEFPFASLDESGKIQRHPPERYLALPLRTHSAMMALMERWWMRSKSRPRERQQRAVTMRLISELRDTAAGSGAEFVVLMLFAPKPRDREQYAGFFASEGISAADCAFKLTPEMRVPGEGHPNGDMNQRWLRCFEPDLRSLLDSLP
jgi:hypothetical protein